MKFKLTSETKIWLGKTLYRIEALIDFGAVKAGEKGGFVETERNLSQEDNAWVSGNALVYGDALVLDDALVYGDARVYGSALVLGNAHVYGNARVFDNAHITGNAHVSGNARVYGEARVLGNARVSPVNIIGLTYLVTITDDHMMIGCEFHPIADWRAFNARRIIQMDGAQAARFWKTHGQYLLAICDDRAKRDEAAE